MKYTFKDYLVGWLRLTAPMVFAEIVTIIIVLNEQRSWSTVLSYMLFLLIWTVFGYPYYLYHSSRKGEK